MYLKDARITQLVPRSIDAADATILAEQQADARLTVAQLAQCVHLSTSPAWRRVKRLEEVGLITGYHAALSRRGLGWGVLVFASAAVESHSEQRRALSKPRSRRSPIS